MDKRPAIMLGAFLLSLSYAADAHADIVFPAIANQFVSAFAVGFYWSVVLAVLILAVETIFIKKLLGSNYFISFLLSFIINLISSVAGLIITSIPFGHGRNIFAYGDMRLGTYLGMVPGYLLTAVLEWALLALCAKLLRQKKGAWACAKTSALMNLCSYAILLAGIIAADLATKGRNFNLG